MLHVGLKKYDLSWFIITIFLWEKKLSVIIPATIFSLYKYDRLSIHFYILHLLNVFMLVQHSVDFSMQYRIPPSSWISELLTIKM